MSKLFLKQFTVNNVLTAFFSINGNYSLYITDFE